LLRNQTLRGGLYVFMIPPDQVARARESVAPLVGSLWDHSSPGSWIAERFSGCKRYVNLVKPGIVMGNAISVTGGFFLASHGHANFPLFLMTLVAVSLVVGSGCAFNNVIDRDIDAIMVRTKDRVLVTGLVSPRRALAWAAFLGVAGLIILGAEVTPLAAMLALVGFVVYVGLYSLYLKRHSVHGTLVGSVAGAMPPVIGYCAVTGRFDAGAALILLIFALWQMPHSYAIAILRTSDYAAAGIPVLPVKSGIAATKRQIIAYIVALMVAVLALAADGYAGFAYTVVATGVTIYWLAMAITGFRTTNDVAWARRMFVCSIVVVAALSVAMSLDADLDLLF